MSIEAHAGFVLLVVISLVYGTSSAASTPASAACPNPILVEHGTGCVCTGTRCGVYARRREVDLKRFETYLKPFEIVLEQI